MQRIFKWFKRLVITGIVLIVGFFLADWIDPLPMPEDDMARVVLAEDGTPLWRFADENGVWRYSIKLEEVSPLYIDAVLTYEDRWFYKHPGINPIALIRATWQNLTGGQIVSGGSTLSMQVARLLDPHPRTLKGKIKQAWRTIQLEWHYSKDEILQLYLNRAPFGGTLEGVAAASWSYLGKSPKELTPSEAALLAVLPQAPSRLRPDRHPERAQSARDKVLDRLAEFKVWSADRVREAKEDTVMLAPRNEPQLAPLLARRLNIKGVGERIHTTIDANLQRRLEDMLLTWSVRLPKQTSAAILVVDHQNLAVKAYLGSVNIEDNQRFGHVDMVSSIRSPGSTLKPFLYGLALDEGLIHSESLLQDVPLQGEYRPANFSRGFIGPVSVSSALGMSLNVPVVQLLSVYGPKRFSGELRSAGIKMYFNQGAEPNLAVILGGVGMRLEHLVSAYTAFARKGQVGKLRFKVTDPVVEKPLLSASSAWIIRRIMSGQARPDIDPNANLIQRQPLAWKTGTSYGFRDAWAIGVSDRYVIGVWIGRPDGTPVPGQFGLSSATPLLLQVHDMLSMRDQQLNLPLINDPKPQGVDVAVICWPQGQVLNKNDPNCRRTRFAWTVDNTIPPTLLTDQQSLLQPLTQTIWLNEQNLRVDASCAGARAEQITLWPSALEPWLPSKERRRERMPAIDPKCPPLQPELTETPIILGVIDQAHLQRPKSIDEVLTLEFTVQGGAGNKWWFLNGSSVGQSAEGESFKHQFTDSGKYQLIMLDQIGQTAMLEFFVDN